MRKLLPHQSARRRSPLAPRWPRWRTPSRACRSSPPAAGARCSTRLRLSLARYAPERERWSRRGPAFAYVGVGAPVESAHRARNRDGSCQGGSARTQNAGSGRRRSRCGGQLSASSGHQSRVRSGHASHARGRAAPPRAAEHRPVPRWPLGNARGAPPRARAAAAARGDLGTWLVCPRPMLLLAMR